MHPKICAYCGKEFGTKAYVANINITGRSEFRIVKRVEFCSYTCKTKYEARVREEFEESHGLNIR